MTDSNKENYRYIWLGIGMLAGSILSCRPVIAIGWQEFLLLLLLFLFLFGPPLYRLMRRIEDFRKHERKRK